MRISGDLPNLINGVSQQPAALRLSSQLEAQDNCHSTVVDGLTKRPPTNRVARLWQTTAPYVSPRKVIKTHLINRDANERYVVVLATEGDGKNYLKVWDFAGNEKTVRYPSGSDYLQGITSPEILKIMTVADYSFVLNKRIAVANRPDRVPVRPKEALVHVQAGNYGRTYEIIINGVLATSITTYDGSAPEESQNIDTTKIAVALINGQKNDKGVQENGLVANGYTTANGWFISQFQNAIYIYRTDGVDFTIETKDGYGGKAMVAIKDTVQDFSSLPNYAPDGFVCGIEGSPGNDSDNYWVRFTKQSSSTAVGTGVWKEASKPGEILGLDPKTMPHVLVRDADGSFTFRPQAWDDRVAGDENEQPGPSFVGRSIADVFFFRNRLGFLADENVILSRAGDFWNFYRKTATALLDDDPIDVAASHTRISMLKYAIPFQERLLLFSPNTQFVFRGGDTLTPKTANMQPLTEFESAPNCAPTSSGRNVFFAVRRGEFTMVREYAVSDDGNIGDAEDITSHVPQYVPKDIEALCSSTHEDTMVVRSEVDPASLYVYKWFVSGERKLQSSWSRWSFPNASRVHAAEFIESSLYLVVLRPDEVALERIDLQPALTDAGSTFVIHMDRKAPLGISGRVYDEASDTTRIPCPYQPTADLQSVTAASSYVAEGLSIPVAAVGYDTITVQGDQRTTPLWCGFTYRSLGRLSTIYVRKADQNGAQKTLTEGRLQLLTGYLQFSDTGYIRVEVTPQARPTNTFVFNGRIVGDPMNIVGEAVLSNDRIRFPILSKNDRVVIDIVNDSYLPMAITAMEWMGTFTTKARRA